MRSEFVFKYERGKEKGDDGSGWVKNRIGRGNNGTRTCLAEIFNGRGGDNATAVLPVGKREHNRVPGPKKKNGTCSAVVVRARGPTNGSVSVSGFVFLNERKRIYRRRRRRSVI